MPQKYILWIQAISKSQIHRLIHETPKVCQSCLTEISTRQTLRLQKKTEEEHHLHDIKNLFSHKMCFPIGHILLHNMPSNKTSPPVEHAFL